MKFTHNSLKSDGAWIKNVRSIAVSSKFPTISSRHFQKFDSPFFSFPSPPKTFHSYLIFIVIFRALLSLPLGWYRSLFTFNESRSTDGWCNHFNMLPQQIENGIIDQCLSMCKSPLPVAREGEYEGRCNYTSKWTEHVKCITPTMRTQVAKCFPCMEFEKKFKDDTCAYYMKLCLKESSLWSSSSRGCIRPRSAAEVVSLHRKS